MRHNGVELIDKIVPASGLNFPMVDAQYVSVDGSGKRLTEALNDKEESMHIFTSLPQSGVLQVNGYYALGSLSEIDISVSLADGSLDGDMIYLSFLPGDLVTFSIVGTNYAGLSAVDTASGGVIEVSGVWNSAAGKWLMTHRRISLQ